MKWDISKFVVIVHGNLRQDPKVIETAWEGFSIIWSIWKDQNIETVNTVVQSEYPENYGVQNLALQKVSLYEGLLKAKEMGYERAIKWRTDQYPTNANRFVELFDPSSVNLLFWHNFRNGYYVDYFMEGSIDDLISIWDFDTFDYPYSEYKTTDQIIKKGVKVNCIGKHLTLDNDVVWVNRHPDKKLSSYNSDQLFQTVNIN